MGDTDAIELAGRVLLPDGTEHDCRIRFDEAERIEIVLDVPLRSGMHLICQVDGLGCLDAVVEGYTPAGRRLGLQSGAVHASRLSARMAWHRARAAGEVDQRGHGRIVPRSTTVTVSVGGGTETEGTLIDLSASGAALCMPERPPVGAQIVVGRRRATVIRHRDDGLAVRFAMSLRPQDVTPDVIL